VVKFSRTAFHNLSGDPPPGDAVDGPRCIFVQLIFVKIITTVATRGQIVRLKCIKQILSAGGGACSAPQTP